MSQIQVPVHYLHTSGVLMAAVCIPRGVMEILTAQMAVMKWLVQVSGIDSVLPPSIDLNIGALASLTNYMQLKNSSTAGSNLYGPS